MQNLYDTMHSNEYSLSIRLSSDGFSLCVYDESNSLLSTKKVSISLFSMSEEEINQLLILEKETQLNFKDIRLICESDNYTFVPAQIFKPEEARDFLLFQHELNKKDQILVNMLPVWDIVNVFCIPNALYNALTHLFPNSPIEHHVSWFLTDKVQFGSESNLQIWVRPKMMDVVVLTNGNLILINSFAYNTPEDFTYFTLNIFEQLSLETEKHIVKLFHLEKKRELLESLEKYIKHCETGN